MTTPTSPPLKKSASEVKDGAGIETTGLKPSDTLRAFKRRETIDPGSSPPPRSSEEPTPKSKGKVSRMLGRIRSTSMSQTLNPRKTKVPSTGANKILDMFKKEEQKHKAEEEELKKKEERTKNFVPQTPTSKDKEGDKTQVPVTPKVARPDIPKTPASTGKIGEIPKTPATGKSSDVPSTPPPDSLLTPKPFKSEAQDQSPAAPSIQRELGKKPDSATKEIVPPTIKRELYKTPPREDADKRKEEEEKRALEIERMRQDSEKLKAIFARRSVFSESISEKDKNQEKDSQKKDTVTPLVAVTSSEWSAPARGRHSRGLTTGRMGFEIGRLSSGTETGKNEKSPLKETLPPLKEGTTLQLPSLKEGTTLAEPSSPNTFKTDPAPTPTRARGLTKSAVHVEADRLKAADEAEKKVRDEMQKKRQQLGKKKRFSIKVNSEAWGHFNRGKEQKGPKEQKEPKGSVFAEAERLRKLAESEAKAKAEMEQKRKGLAVEGKRHRHKPILKQARRTRVGLEAEKEQKASEAEQQAKAEIGSKRSQLKATPIKATTERTSPSSPVVVDESASFLEQRKAAFSVTIAPSETPSSSTGRKSVWTQSVAPNETPNASTGRKSVWSQSVALGEPPVAGRSRAQTELFPRSTSEKDLAQEKEKEDREKKEKEDREKKEKEDREKKEKTDRERKEKEAREKKLKEDRLTKLKTQITIDPQEMRVRELEKIAKQRKTQVEREKKEKEEREKKEKEENEKKEKEEREKRARENRERREQENKAKKEVEDAERKAKAEKQKADREKWEKEAQEKKVKEEKERNEKREREEKERKEKEEKERKEQEERAKAEKERVEKELRERLEKEERELKERLEKEEKERKEKEEKERKEKEEKERKEKEERERKEKEERARKEKELREKKEKEDREIKEKREREDREREAQEKKAREEKLEREKRAREEKERKEKEEREKREKEEKEKSEKEAEELKKKLALLNEQEAKLRLEREQKEKEEAEKRRKEQEEKERKEKEEKERKEREEQERREQEEKEKREREQQLKREQEDRERERKLKEEQEKLEQEARERREKLERELKEKKEKEERERKEREEKERKEQEERLRLAKEELERKEREAREKLERELQERREKEEQERKARAEQERREKEERERKEREEQERREREEREQREREEREQREREEREERERKEREEREQKELEEQERKEREEQEQKEREELERKEKERKEEEERLKQEALEKEKREKARQEKEKEEREKREKELAEKARLARQLAERERIERERTVLKDGETTVLEGTEAPEKKTPSSQSRRSTPGHSRTPSTDSVSGRGGVSLKNVFTPVVTAGQETSSTRVLCGSCNLPLKPTWAKFCNKCGAQQKTAGLDRKLSRRESSSVLRGGIKEEPLPEPEQKLDDKQFMPLPEVEDKEESHAAYLALRKQTPQSPPPTTKTIAPVTEQSQLLDEKQEKLRKRTEISKKPPWQLTPSETATLKQLDEELVVINKKLEQYAGEELARLEREKKEQELLEQEREEERRRAELEAHVTHSQEEIDAREELEHTTARVQKLKHRQINSPWMFSDKDKKLLKRLERRKLVLKIGVLQYDIERATSNPEEARMRGTFEEKSAKLKAYKAKPPWMWSKADEKDIKILTIATEGLQKTLTELDKEHKTRAERMEKLQKKLASFGKPKEKVVEAPKASEEEKMRQELEAKTAEVTRIRLKAPWMVTYDEREILKLYDLQIAALKQTLEKLASLWPKHCQQCGAQLAAYPHNKFCKSCGAKQEPIVEDKKIVRLECSRCRNFLKTRSKFCLHCGEQNPHFKDDELWTREDNTKKSAHGQVHVGHQGDADESGPKGEGSDDEADDDVDSDYDEDEYTPIVLDNGSWTFKCGLSSSDLPSLVVPSIAAHVAAEKDTSGSIRGGAPDDEDDVLYGNQVQEKGLLDDSSGRTIPDILFPLFSDHPPSWDDLAGCWQFLFDSMGIDTDTERDHAIICTHPTFAPLEVSRTMYEVMFEHFHMPAVHVCAGPLLAAYSYGDSTALVVDIGHTAAQVVPVVEGFMFEHQIRRADHLGGARISQHLINNFAEEDVLLSSIGYKATSLAHTIKEKLAWTAGSSYDFRACIERDDLSKNFTFESEGDQVELTLHEDILEAGELCFQPKTILDDRDESILSIQRLVAEVIYKCSLDVRVPLLNNILLSGGTTMMQGFVPRFTKELKRVLPHAKTQIRVRADKHRAFAVWGGGAILANIESFQEKWYSSWEYEERGLDGLNDADDDL